MPRFASGRQAAALASEDLVLEAFDLPQLVALAAVLGFASGIRLYAVLLVIGLVGYAGWLPLPEGLAVLAHPVVLGVSALMFVVEFCADKWPFIDSLWDAVHSFVRIPAGAALAAAVVGGEGAVGMAAAAILGGSLAAASHFTKAGARLAINASPEPLSNVAASSGEDVLVGGLLWLVLVHPLAAAGVLLVLVIASVWALFRLTRFLRRGVGHAGGGADRTER